MCLSVYFTPEMLVIMHTKLLDNKEYHLLEHGQLGLCVCTCILHIPCSMHVHTHTKLRKFDTNIKVVENGLRQGQLVRLVKLQPVLVSHT